MTELMFRLRRSPRTLLARDGYPGPGAGKLALVMARAGVGKTAFLVGVGVDALLAGQRVLHISLERRVEKIREWYDDLLMEMLRREKKLQHLSGIQIDMERRRHILTYGAETFSASRVRQSIELLVESMDFAPQVIIVDRLEAGAGPDPQEIADLRELARDHGAELWIACRVHRTDPPTRDGHLPAPAEPFESDVDLAFLLDPQDAKIRLHVIKDEQRVIDTELNVVLDPKTMLLQTGLGARPAAD